MFEFMWLKDPECAKIIEKYWVKNCQGSKAFQFVSKVRNIARRLDEWNKTHFGSIGRKIKEIETEVAAL